MTPAELFAGVRSQVRIGARPEHLKDRGGRRAKQGRRVLSLVATVYARGKAERRTVTWPIILHRPLPDDCRIQSIAVHRERRAGQWVWSVSITVRVRLPARKIAGVRAAVNLGWRATPEGIRVATILRDGDAEPQYIHLPQRIIDAVGRSEDYRSRTDQQVLSMLEWVGRIKKADAPQALQDALRGLDAQRRPQPRHFVRLKQVWEREAAHWQPEAFRELEAFVRHNHRHWWNDANRRWWIKDARKSHYEAEVLRLLGEAHTIIINQHDMSQTAEAVTDSNLPLPARHSRVVAAPHVVRLVIANLARRSGMQLVQFDGRHDHCVNCGALFAVKDPSRLWWSCRSCGAAFDQDEHYCRLMLREWLGAIDHPEDDRNPENPKKPTSRRRTNRKSLHMPNGHEAQK
jgi:hypothetical protein